MSVSGTVVIRIVYKEFLLALQRFVYFLGALQMEFFVILGNLFNKV